MRAKASDVWSVGLTSFEALTGEAAFNPKLSLKQLLKAIDGAARPSLPRSARPELAQVLQACWNADPKERPSALEMNRKFRSVDWMLVEGADEEQVKAFLSKVPLDSSASMSEYAAALEKSQRENASQKAELGESQRENASQKAELDALRAQQAGGQAERAEVSGLRRANQALQALLRAKDPIGLQEWQADEGDVSAQYAAAMRLRDHDAGRAKKHLEAVAKGGHAEARKLLQELQKVPAAGAACVTFSDGSVKAVPARSGEWTGSDSQVLGPLDKIVKVILPVGVTSLGEKAFENFKKLKEVVIVAGCTSIGQYAFKGCTSLASITIPTGCTSIGDWAFDGCTSLASITIPTGCTSIGNDAFNGCTSLASISIPTGCASIGNHAFSGCTSLASITIPTGCTSNG
jgi:hypothetical protein